VAARPAEHGSVAVGDPPPAAEGLHLDDGRGPDCFNSGGRRSGVPWPRVRPSIWAMSSPLHGR
jgi:hypothetical protein